MNLNSDYQHYNLNVPMSQNYYNQMPIYQNLSLPTNLIEQTQNSIQNLLSNLKNEKPKKNKHYSKINYQTNNQIIKTNLSTNKSNSKSKMINSIQRENKRNKISSKSKITLDDSNINKKQNLSFNESSNSTHKYEYSFSKTPIYNNQYQNKKMMRYIKRDLSEDLNGLNKIKIQLENLKICNKRNKSEINNINSEFDMLKNDILLQLNNYLRNYQQDNINQINSNEININQYNALINQV